MKYRLRKMLCMVLCMILLGLPVVTQAASGDTNAAAVHINYVLEQAEITNAPFARVYFAVLKSETAVPGIWNYIYVEDGAGNIDLSSIITTKTSYLAVSLDQTHSNYVVYPILPSPKVVNASNIDQASISLRDTNKVLYQGSLLEYKIGKRGSYFTLPFDASLLIQNTRATGAVMTVRVKATQTSPASNEVSIKLSKDLTPPTVSVNTSKLTVVIKKGQQYRVNYFGNSEEEGWSQVIHQNVTMDLRTLGGNTGDSIEKEYLLEVRTAATSKKAASKANALLIQAQPDAPSIGIEDTSNLIFYSAASKGVQKYYIKNGMPEKNIYDKSFVYEYTVVQEGADLDLTKAKWGTISNKGTALAGFSSTSTVYVRSKAVAASTKLGTATIFAGKTRAYQAADFLSSIQSDYLKELLAEKKVSYTTIEELSALDTAFTALPTKVITKLKENKVTFQFITKFKQKGVVGLCKSYYSYNPGTNEVATTSYEIFIKKNSTTMEETIAHEVGHAFDYIIGIELKNTAPVKALSGGDAFAALYNENRVAYPATDYEKSTVTEFFAGLIKDYAFYYDEKIASHSTIKTFLEKYVK